jgi:quercetin dioxygenase-like cupin family protein
MMAKIGIANRLQDLSRRMNDAASSVHLGQTLIGPAALALSLAAMIGFSNAAGLDESSIDKSHDTIIYPRFPAGRPAGDGAKVTAVSRKRMLNLHEGTLSTFMVEYAPGGLAVLPRSTAYGYVLMYVLSGSIKATAWEAGVGTYKEGETWVFPAYGNKIATRNTSTDEPARAFLVLVTGDAKSPSPNADSETSGEAQSAKAPQPEAIGQAPTN